MLLIEVDGNDPAAVEADLRAIKRAWDPNSVMNPCKIFDLGASP